MSTDSSSNALNRLAQEKSPYLLQHASNPVDWYPWGEAAFSRARTEDKLIFLSVGYSTCHWCHVMEKESFENTTVAAVMNRHYINIKVDREERPDVDKLYMSFVQVMTGGGGWPMSVFLTPDLKPVYGGTYFPPNDSLNGGPGFQTLLETVAEQWRINREQFLTVGGRFVDVLRTTTVESSPSPGVSTLESQGAVPGESVWTKLAQQLVRAYDATNGGFSRAPKFPQPSNFNALLHVYSLDAGDSASQLLAMCLKTLTKIAMGGIHDHVNSGFARYSVDNRWHVPHFEKMLYDQAQLAVSYTEAYTISKEDFYADVVHDILRYVGRDLSHPLGGFYGAEDADSLPATLGDAATHKKEGAFCVWDWSEIRELISDAENLEVFTFHYNVKEEGNVDPLQDPHGELTNQNVLACFGTYTETAEKFDKTVEEVKDILKECHDVLYAARQKRPKPQLDTKIVTAWNGLMVSGYARAGFTLNEEMYVDRAIQAVNFIRTHLYSEETKELLRCCYATGDDIVQISEPIGGFLDDYAFVVRGLLDLYEATLNVAWLEWANTLQTKQNELFWDVAGNSGYFTSPEGDHTILIRSKEEQDGAEPSGNSVAVQNLLRLAAYFTDETGEGYKLKAKQILISYANKLKAIPIALPEMVSGLILFHRPPIQIIIAGDRHSEITKEFLNIVRNVHIPYKVLILADGPEGPSKMLYEKHEILAKMSATDNRVYVCKNFTCASPCTEPIEFEQQLKSLINIK